MKLFPAKKILLIFNFKRDSIKNINSAKNSF